MTTSTDLIRRPRYDVRMGLLPLACLMLAACGGGGGGGTDDDSGSGDDGSVSLSSEADVLREVSLLSSAVSAIDTVSGTLGASATAATASSQPLLLRAPAAKAQAVPAADNSEFCTGGGTDERTTGIKTRSFPYFSNLSTSVAYQVDTFGGCKRTRTDESTGDSVQVTLDGVAEAGATPNAVSGADYRYLIVGTGGTPLQAVVDAEAGAKLSFKLLGTEEIKSTDILVTVGSILALDFNASVLGQSRSGEIELGSGTTAFYFASSQTSTAYSLDGPYAYHTSNCEGGAALADTTVNLTTASDGDSSYINGGTLKLSTTSAAVTVVFNGDGSASYQFQNGSSGTLTRAELDEAMQSQTCGF